MGGLSFEEDSGNITLVLVGKTGNGKSATGNSILGTNMFKSKRSSCGVTSTSALCRTELENGQFLNVIDTPGLSDSSLDQEFIGKEIANCINLAKDGIHAFLFVVSIRTRFSEDEKAAITSLLKLFGKKIYDYMILVFTGGDELQDDGETLEDFLHDSPEALKEILSLCGYRCVLFDNKTKDTYKLSSQVQKLFSLVNVVSKNNGGKMFSNEIFTEVKKWTAELEQKGTSVPIEQRHEELFKRIFEMVEFRLMETTMKLEQQLAEERAARVKAEREAKFAQKKSDEERLKLQEKLEDVEKREAELRKQREAELRKQREDDLHKQMEELKKQAEELRNKSEKQAGRNCVIM